MSTRCLFGIFIFGTNSSVIYRFVTDELFEHLIQCFKKRGYRLDTDLEENNQFDNDNEPRLSVDDGICQHLSALLRIHEQTSERHDPIRRIRLETGVQVYFDQIAENTLICMVDKSFDTIIVLKTINLFKALIKFHIGALPFINYNVADQLINRISASLQYYLNHITTNQALLFESCENLLLNSIIRDQCQEVCAMVGNDIQTMIKVPRKVILITCHDKLVHMYISPDQSRPNNADLFLLLLNNISRSLRKDFQSQTNNTSVMSHRFETRIYHHSSSMPNSTRTSTDSGQFAASERAQSCPEVSTADLSGSNERAEKIHRSEVVFLKTSDKVIAPFTLFTIPITSAMSVLILIEWENSRACSHLYELIRHLDSCTSHGLFPYNTLEPQVRAVESSAAVRRYFEQAGHSSTYLSHILNQAHALHRSSARINGNTDQRQRNGLSILRHLTDMSRLSTDVFRDLFFDSDEYARRCGVDTDKDPDVEVQMDGVGPTETKLRRNEYDTSSMTKILRKKFIFHLEDWFSFIEVKSQRNITMNFCHNDFPGLVHFVFIDRLRGQICAPTLIDDVQERLLINNFPHESEYFIERKILAFEVECLLALQQGFTSYTMTDEYFTYNYTLRLQENNGASLRLHKSFVQSHPPSVLHADFYKALAEECYPKLIYQSTVNCFELISVHLRIVPANVVRFQCERLWPKLMEPFE